MSKPKGLPPVETSGKETPPSKGKSAPEGLPEVKTSAHGSAGTDRARICKKCGQEARIVSNNTGVQAYCGPCKINWPISSQPYKVDLPITAGRGLRKETIVEPDWDMAFQDIGEPSGSIGPKR
jgi:hypothetical protein